MTRVITIIILLTAFAAQTFNRTLITLGYYTNPAAFAKNCENKARPQLHCKGKCQMMKKLLQEEKKDQQNPERKQENKNEVLFCRSSFATVPTVILSHLDSRRPLFNTGRPVHRSYAIFHPPSAA